ncbi:hypothetical protein C4573_03820 [Candidatus Woesearchaeota archaeon]|nr:MAG: hypothetical protein C4573_03820 [Candidatus Woesearchaeota archaeon]
MANEETEKRKKVLETLLAEKDWKQSTSGIFLGGSVAYGPEYGVRKDSDIDLVLITNDFLPLLRTFKNHEQYEHILKNRFFEGICLKFEQDGIPVSVHILTEDALDIIAKCFVADLRLLREGGKAGTYLLRGFEGQEYPYSVKNIPLEKAQGFYRTIVPISFINNDRYFIGIHRDKLMSNPQIIYDPHGIIERAIDKTWNVMMKNFIDESRRLYGTVDPSRMSIARALVKFNAMDDDVQKSIQEKERAYLAMLT